MSPRSAAGSRAPSGTRRRCRRRRGGRRRAAVRARAPGRAAGERGKAPVTARGFRVADSDMHVLEPPDLWQRYIDPAWRHAAPVGLTELRRDMRVKVKSHVLLRIGPVRPMRGTTAGAWSAAQDQAFADAEARGWDATSQVEAMRAEGLDLAVLFPSRGLFVLGLDSPQVVGVDGLEPDFAAAIARPYNDWL